MKKIILLFILWFYLCSANSQSVGIGTSNPNPTAVLDLTSTSQGFLLTRLTINQRNSISNPATGLIIYCIDCDEIELFNGNSWKNLTGQSACISPGLPNINICAQNWSTQNLNVSHYLNGDSIPQVTDPSVWVTLTTGGWCWYNNDSVNYAKYGKLYNWYAVNDPRGIAPVGWHIPSDAEWTSLTNCLGGEAVAGGKMKSLTLWNSPNTGATDSSGFSGLPAGQRLWDTGAFDTIGTLGHFWSTTSVSSSLADLRRLNYDNIIVSNFFYYKTAGFSVRCVKN